jgi:hypothetical protein
MVDKLTASWTGVPLPFSTIGDQLKATLELAAPYADMVDKLRSTWTGIGLPLNTIGDQLKADLVLYQHIGPGATLGADEEGLSTGTPGILSPEDISVLARIVVAVTILHLLAPLLVVAATATAAVALHASALVMHALFQFYANHPEALRDTPNIVEFSAVVLTALVSVLQLRQSRKPNPTDERVLALLESIDAELRRQRTEDGPLPPP